jgi:predicted nucleic acid-binding protein
MSQFFLDASALAKLYLTETGSNWINALLNPATNHVISIAEITQVEVAAALAARHRASGGISRQIRDSAVNLLARHCQQEYQLMALTPLILDRAVYLTQNHRLRGYDAVQLATALAAQQTFTASGLTGLTFVTADTDLLTAAQAEGLTSDNPNLYS